MASSTFGSMTLSDLNTLRNDLKGWENWELTELLQQNGTTNEADVANTIEYLRNGLLLPYLPPDVDMNTMTLEEAVRFNDEKAKSACRRNQINSLHNTTDMTLHQLCADWKITSQLLDHMGTEFLLRLDALDLLNEPSSRPAGRKIF